MPIAIRCRVILSGFPILLLTGSIFAGHGGATFPAPERAERDTSGIPGSQQAGRNSRVSIDRASPSELGSSPGDIRDDGFPPLPQSKEDNTRPDAKATDTQGFVERVALDRPEAGSAGVSQALPGISQGFLVDEVAKVNLQAVLRDADGLLYEGETVDLAVGVYGLEGSLVTGPIELLGTPVSGGIVNVRIPIPPAAMDSHAVELELTVNGEVIPDRIALSAVPYAYRVNRVASEELDDQVELGGPLDQGAVRVYNGVYSTEVTVELSGLNNEVVTYSDNGMSSARLGGYAGGRLRLDDIAGNMAALLEAVSGFEAGGTFRLFRSGEVPAIEMEAEVDDGAVATFFNAQGEKAVFIDTHGTALDDESGDAFVGIERSPWGGEINLRDAGGNHGVKLTGSPFGGGLLNLYQPANHTISCALFSSTSGGHLQLLDGAGVNTVYARADGSGDAGQITMSDADGNIAIDLVSTYVDPEAGSLGSQVSLHDMSGDEEVSIRAFDRGQILLKHDEEVTMRLDADGATGSGELSLFAANGVATLRALGNEPVSGSGGGLALYNGNSTTNRRTLLLDGGFGGTSSGGGIQLFNTDEQATITLDGDDEGAGRIWVENSDSSYRVLLDGDAGFGQGEVRVRDEDGTSTILLSGAEGAGQGGQIEVRRADGAPTIFIDGDINDGSEIAMRNADGQTTIRLDAHNGSSGMGRIYTEVLQITGGSDLAEGFDISPGDGEILPGSVVAIDVDQPGKLRITDKPYDPCVAGVISGAGGVRPGMLMGQAGSDADGAYPVALTGRVYCLVDATFGAIVPGDLLTTSSTAGHAMKVRDHDLSRGAVIGKAMSSLDSGRGLVLVLVSLQ